MDSSASYNSHLIELWTATEHDGTAWCVAWSPRGDMLASCGSDKTLRIWAAPPSGGDDFSTWTCIAALEGDLPTGHGGRDWTGGFMHAFHVS